uniref:Uncharacterized protein n=1 Tax=Anguilla anguilla TaxID=7936 RepID=A0A0E9RLS6_ANGAN
MKHALNYHHPIPTHFLLYLIPLFTHLLLVSPFHSNHCPRSPLQ